MAGWSILTDGSALDCNEIIRKLQSNGFCLDVNASLKRGVDGGKHKLRCLFSVFLKEISAIKHIRALMLGDGRSVDLFKPFMVVREKGGNDFVLKNGFWACVAVESGLESAFTLSVKVIYIKLELEIEFRGLLSEMLDREEKDEEYPQKEMQQSAMGNMNNTNEVRIVSGLDNVDKSVEDKEEVVILDPSILKEDPFSRKRKLESLSGMLNWVTEIAKDPGNSAMRMLLEGSEWNMCGRHAMLARQALFLRMHADSSVWQSLLQKKQKINPSMYEDPVGADDQSTERLRCSERLLLKKSHSRSSSKPSSATESDLDMSVTPCLTGLDTVDSFTNLVLSLFGDVPLQKQVPVGPLFQAEVPDWTGMTSESDSKWLGTRVWPLEKGERNLLIERDPMGKGRQDSCGCQFPGSIECVRFHIGEKRMRVKLELGLAFHRWGFNRMGEEVSLPWTDEEEQRFKAIVRLNPPSLEKCYWDQVIKSFHAKSRENLVSYYFNVFLLRRRSYQNRVTPNNIDSDDDESEFGYVSFGLGHEAVKVRSPLIWSSTNM
ncbi:hypothetical protein HHK36_000187 [Tetracentron sinense]|uniref:Uncharacterized protein n=1 Tax=Tetracentron sinense TaxID=13715 RepID=A0A834ZTP4_TETSI|nr:hypothetical protein HHK36_000187 [Tetracentron sinense]